MTRNLGCLLGIGIGLLLGVEDVRAAPAERVTRDASGRVIARHTARPDGSGHRTSLQYRSDSAQAFLVVDEDLDSRERVTARVEQHFGEDGKLVERVETRIDAAGNRAGTRTRYSYDAKGRRAEQALPLE